MTTEQGNEMNQTEKQAMAAYKDVLRTIVSLVAPPPRAMHEERLLAAILLALAFGGVVVALWFGAWRYPVTLALMVVGSTFIVIAAVMARGKRGAE